MAGSMRTFVTDGLTDGLTDMTDFRGHSVCPKSFGHDQVPHST